MPRPNAAFATFSAILAGIAACVGACTVEPACSGNCAGQPQTGGSSAGQPGAGAGQGGTTGGAAAGSPTGGASAGNAGAATGGATGGLGGASGLGGGGGTGGLGGAGGVGGGSNKMPMCVTNDVAGGVERATNNYIECDVEDQAIDFDVTANYAMNRKPGYDPSTTPVTFTDFGTALTGYAVQECHPYCYKANLTLGLDLLEGADTSLRGEVLFGFPPGVAPIANAAGRNSLGWFWIDGPALPAGTKLTFQMVLKSNDNGILLSNELKDAVPQKWFEFKHFPIDQGFDKAKLTNITHIGFRVTLSPTNMAADWHGVVYADHFQLRK